MIGVKATGVNSGVIGIGDRQILGWAVVGVVGSSMKYCCIINHNVQEYEMRPLSKVLVFHK